MKLTKLFSGITLFAWCLSAAAGDWPQWRGPNFNGTAAEKGLPSSWTKESAVWTVDLPGAGAATPVILGDLVFVSSPDTQSNTLRALCLDRKTGKVLWNKSAGEGIGRSDNSNFASPSPVAAPDRVYFFFGNGSLIALDNAGKEIWTRNITKDYGDFAFQWTFAASPLLYGGKLYLQVLQRNVPVHGRGKEGGESFLLALDPATGKTLWRQVRPSDANAESLEAYSTPMPFESNGRKEILIAGGDCLTGHDPESGKELWRWGTWNPDKIGHWRLVPSPIAGAGVALACAPKGDPIYAIQLGGKGTLDNSAIAWKSDRRQLSSDVPTPLFYDGDFFVLSDGKKSISRVDPATGKPKWTVEVGGRPKLEASPTAGDGKIYFMNFAGDTFVVEAVEGKLLDTIKMGDDGDNMTRSSIPIAGGQLFIRTNHKLYCIGRK